MPSEYRIEYSIQRRSAGEDDFTEIGFGSSEPESTVEAALYTVQSQVQNGMWEVNTDAE